MSMFSFPDQFLGVRIDKALAEYFQLPRNLIQQLFERGQIMIYDPLTHSYSLIKKSYHLLSGDQFQLPELTRYEDITVLKEAPYIDIPILYETSDYLIIYKPKGVLSHPKHLLDISQPSLVGFLYHRFGSLPSTGSFIRSGIIHRLDKDTDGLMIVARSERGLQYFRSLFDAKAKNALEGLPFDDLHKYYQAKTIITPHGDQRLNSLIYHGEYLLPYYIDSLVQPCYPVFGYPKRGITSLLSLQRVDAHCLMAEVELLTGRTHQIRYHLASLGLPIYGDILYGSEKNKDNLIGKQLALTAYKIDFIDCDGVRKCFKL